MVTGRTTRGIRRVDEGNRGSEEEEAVVITSTVIKAKHQQPKRRSSKRIAELQATKGLYFNTPTPTPTRTPTPHGISHSDDDYYDQNYLAYLSHFTSNPNSQPQPQVQPSEAVSHMHLTKNLKKTTQDSKETERNEVDLDHGDRSKKTLGAEGEENPFQAGFHGSQTMDPFQRGCDELHLLEKRDTPDAIKMQNNQATIGAHPCSVFTNADASISRKMDHTTSNFEARASNFFLKDHRQHLSTASSWNLTEMVQHMDDASTGVDSFGCDTTLVSVNGYEVKPHYADLLRSIISKHGDIAINCSSQSKILRSLFLEHLCELLQKLEKTSLLAIKEYEMNYMLDFVSDLEGMRIEVGWIKKTLEEICEAKQAVLLYKDLEHSQNERKIKIQELESHVIVRQRELEAANNELSVAKAEAKAAEDMISENKAKIRKIVELGELPNVLI